jgi:hypothetical protein
VDQGNLVVVFLAGIPAMAAGAMTARTRCAQVIADGLATLAGEALTDARDSVGHHAQALADDMAQAFDDVHFAFEQAGRIAVVPAQRAQSPPMLKLGGDHHGSRRQHGADGEPRQQPAHITTAYPHSASPSFIRPIITLARRCMLWPVEEISSVSGWAVTAEVLRFTPAWFQGGPRLDYLDRPVRQYEWGSTAHAYQSWVRDRLHHSGLAQLIPGGLDLLPDIYAALPEPYRRFEWELRPRNYRQLARHLLTYLDWYIDPRQPLSLAAQAVTLPRRLPLLVQGANTAALATLFFSPLLAVCWLPLFLAWTAAVPEADLKVGIGVRQLIHAAELYFYLHEAYADAAEETPVTGLRAAD